MTFYAFMKALHLTGVVIWMGAMLVSCLFLAYPLQTGPKQTLRKIMTIGLIITWLVGLWLAISAGWFAAGWMHAKLTLVIVLTAFHGILVKKMKSESSELSQFWKATPFILTIIFFIIALLAGAKFF